MTVDEFTDFVKNKLILFYRPNALYLFGSQANAKATENSDIDFLVISNSNQPKRQRALEFRKTMRGKNLYPIDIIVYTPEEFEKERTVKGTIPYTVSKEGKQLYG
jgi:predicted nucleotidyltransferase